MNPGTEEQKGPGPAAPDSLRKKYLYKLGGGFFSMAMGGIVQMFVPRALGPAAYGDYNFLTSFFTQVTNFLDMGTSYGFYAKLSQRPKEKALVGFYFLFVVFACAAVVLLTLILSTSRWAAAIWPDQKTWFVMLAAVLGVIMWTNQVANKATDAYGLTVPGEIARSVQNAISVVVIVPLFLLHWLDLSTFFYYQYFLTIFLCCSFLRINARHGHPLPHAVRLTKPELKRYAAEFYEYSHPLLTYASVSLITGILGRWLLQSFGGSVQQGFYGFSYQIGAACFLCTSSMTPLLMREFSIANEKKDVPAMAALFKKHIPLLYSVTAYFSCFVSTQAPTILRVLGGAGYGGASTAVALMALYPLHQTYGQLSGSLFYATGRTALFRNIGISIMLTGVAVSYFLLAPRHAGGLNLGATGLALQMLVMQIIAVNAQLFFNARFLGLTLWKFVAHQFVSAAALLVLAHAAGWLADKAVGGVFLGLGSFFLAGMIYSAAVAALCWFAPRLFGLTREQLASAIAGLREKLTLA